MGLLICKGLGIHDPLGKLWRSTTTQFEPSGAERVRWPFFLLNPKLSWISSFKSNQNNMILIVWRLLFHSLTHSITHAVTGLLTNFVVHFVAQSVTHRATRAQRSGASPLTALPARSSVRAKRSESVERSTTAQFEPSGAERVRWPFQGPRDSRPPW